LTKNDGERIAVLEVRMAKVEDQQQQILNKLDELLLFRAKGVGAFWLASALLGTGIVGTVVTVLEWIKSWH